MLHFSQTLSKKKWMLLYRVNKRGNVFMIKMKLIVFIASSLIGCSSNNFFMDMSKSQDKFNQHQSNKILAFMDIETMFPEPKLRSLADAAARGKIQRVNELVKSGVDVNARGHRNATALFWAMKNESGFKALLKLGADPNVVFDDGGSVIHWAARMEDATLLELALQNGGNPNLKAGMLEGPPLSETIHLDIRLGIPESFKVLIKHHADLNQKDKLGSTPLITAAHLARFDIVYELLKRGADPSILELKKIMKRKEKLLLPNSQSVIWLRKVEDWIEDFIK